MGHLATDSHTKKEKVRRPCLNYKSVLTCTASTAHSNLLIVSIITVTITGWDITAVYLRVKVNYKSSNSLIKII